MEHSEADMLRLCLRLVTEQDWPKAWKATNAVLNEYPDSPQALYLMGVIQRAQGNIGLALPLFSKALSIEQKQPNIWMNYGATLHDLNQWESAIQAFTVVHASLPNDPMPMANISASNVQMGKWHDSINWANRALELDPKSHIAHISAGFATLALGRWTDAWKHSEYMYGNQLVIRVYNERENEEPTWDGSPGKTVVIQCDQGVGDIIMFSQMIPQVRAVSREVIIETSERMVPMMRRNFPDCTVYGTIKHGDLKWPADHQIDAHIHISFLGKFYRNRDSEFPRKPYLVPDPELLSKWRDYLSRYEKPWRGFAWRGGIQATQKHIRSIEIADYKPILERAGTNFDLSYHDSKAEIARSGFAIVQPPIDTLNYDDTIAFIAALDEVYSVTTTVAHVCGAIGRSANIVVPEVPTWRYAYRIDGGSGMIWYPKDSVRLFRRLPGEADWSFVINRIDKATR